MKKRLISIILLLSIFLNMTVYASSLDEENNTYGENTISKKVEDKEINEDPKKDKVTVTIKSSAEYNDGIFSDGSEEKVFEIDKGSKLNIEDLEIPKRIQISTKDYFFGGWSTNFHSKPEFLFDFETLLEEDITLYPYWHVFDYRIKFRNYMYPLGYDLTYEKLIKDVITSTKVDGEEVEDPGEDLYIEESYLEEYEGLTLENLTSEERINILLWIVYESKEYYSQGVIAQPNVCVTDQGSLEVNNKNYNYKDEYKEEDLIKLATTKGENNLDIDARDKVEFIYPEGINKDNITEHPGEHKIKIKLKTPDVIATYEQFIFTIEVLNIETLIGEVGEVKEETLDEEQNIKQSVFILDPLERTAIVNIEDVYDLEVENQIYELDEDFKENDLIKKALKNGKSEIDELEFMYPEGINKNNITENLGEVEVKIKFGNEEKIAKVVVSNDYNLEGKDLELNVDDEFNESDLIKLATLGTRDMKEKVKFIYPEGINKDNITEKSGETKVILTLGDKSVEVKVLVKEKPVTEDENNGSSSSKKKRKKKDVTEDETQEVIRPIVKKEKLNKKDKITYLNGYEDNTIRANNYITREEVAAIIYRILDDDYRNEILSDTNNYKDIEKDSWSNKYISTLSKGEILKGYEDNTFRPKEFITRAEFTAILSRFEEEENSIDVNFNDIKGHWAEEEIKKGTKHGISKGYEDNTFKPDEFITRAETTTMINRILERELTNKDKIIDIGEFKDLDKNAWYYEDIVEATNPQNK